MKYQSVIKLENVCACLTQTVNDVGKEKFSYICWWPTKRKEYAEVDVNGGSKNGYEDMQLIWGFGLRWIGT